MKFLPLIVATFIWGLGFAATRWTLISYSPVWSNSLRFVFAGLISLPFLLTRRKIKDWKGPLLCSIFLLTGLQLQTIGLAHTTLAKSGFLTVFYAIFTPIISYFLDRKSFGKSYWLLLGLAMLGMLMLCELEFSNFNKGDLITLVSAVFLSLHIIAVDKTIKDHPPFEFNMHQCFYMGIMGFIFATIYEGLPNLKPLLEPQSLTKQSPLLGFIVLCFFSSHLAFGLQMKAQKVVEAHLVSLFFLLESFFAAIFGWFFFGETLSLTAMIGCFVLMLSVALIPYTQKNSPL